jgi:SAM-dependent methyltransferase
MSIASKPTSSWFDRAICRVAFPLEKFIADLTVCKFSDWAKNEKWLAQFTSQNTRQIPDRSDPIYQSFLKREIAYWQHPSHGDTQTIYAEDHPDRHAKLLAYWHEAVSGSPTLSLVDLLHKLGPFRNAMTLGHFDNLEELMTSSVAQHWTFNSITGRFANSSLSNVSIISEDLNFARFKENEYDLVICVGILHHIVNIDSLIKAINQALTPNGRLVIIDYIGEERFQWKGEKRKYINDIISYMPPKYQRFPFAGIDAIHFGRLSPFEAVTSTQIPKVLETHLSLLESRQSYGVLFPMLHFLKSRYLIQDNPIIDILIDADREASKFGVRPTVLSGIYGKQT